MEVLDGMEWMYKTKLRMGVLDETKSGCVRGD